VKDEASGK